MYLKIIEKRQIVFKCFESSIKSMKILDRKKYTISKWLFSECFAILNSLYWLISEPSQRRFFI